MLFTIEEIITLATEQYAWGGSHSVEVKSHCVIYRITNQLDRSYPRENEWEIVDKWNTSDGICHYINKDRKMIWVYCEGDVTLTVCFDSKAYEKEIRGYEEYAKRQLQDSGE